MQGYVNVLMQNLRKFLWQNQADAVGSMMLQKLSILHTPWPQNTIINFITLKITVKLGNFSS